MIPFFLFRKRRRLSKLQHSFWAAPWGRVWCLHHRTLLHLHGKLPRYLRYVSVKQSGSCLFRVTSFQRLGLDNRLVFLMALESSKPDQTPASQQLTLAGISSHGGVPYRGSTHTSCEGTGSSTCLPNSAFMDTIVWDSASIWEWGREDRLSVRHSHCLGIWSTL